LITKQLQFKPIQRKLNTISNNINTLVPNFTTDNRQCKAQNTEGYLRVMATIDHSLYSLFKF